MSAERQKGAETGANRRGSMPSIVIVDDRVTNRRILSRLASELDSKPVVETFGDPVLALGWLEQNEPDLVVTDCPSSYNLEQSTA